MLTHNFAPTPPRNFGLRSVSPSIVQDSEAARIDDHEGPTDEVRISLSLSIWIAKC